MCAISSLICIAVETTVVAAEEIIGERERAILVRTTGDFSIYIDVVDRLKKDRNVIRAYFACVLYRSSKGQTSYSIKKKKKKKITEDRSEEQRERRLARRRQLYRERRLAETRREARLQRERTAARERRDRETAAQRSIHMARQIRNFPRSHSPLNALHSHTSI